MRYLLNISTLVAAGTLLATPANAVKHLGKRGAMNCRGRASVPARRCAHDRQNSCVGRAEVGIVSVLASHRTITVTEHTSAGRHGVRPLQIKNASQLYTLQLCTLEFADKPKSAAKKSSRKVALTVTNWKGVQKLVRKNKGKVVVVDIWTTTCPLCLAKFPDFKALAKPHGEKVALISVNCDFDGVKDKPPKHYRERVLKFLKKQDATFTNVMLNIPFLGFLNMVDLESTPALFVYDKTGKLVKRFDNDDAKKPADEFTMKQVADLVAKLVAK